MHTQLCIHLSGVKAIKCNEFCLYQDIRSCVSGQENKKRRTAYKCVIYCVKSPNSAFCICKTTKVIST